MKKLFTLFAISAVALGSCRETKTETKEVIREVEVGTPEKTDNEGILERAAKKVDKEVNEEIDKTIDEIGND
ncbi:hypothetical protein [Aequorivita xiaoshiensis]|uniref:Uncharacterized protein n=1 Tax=Aequorivita xiaoshiensis TaxID=2874476 RepID=A0A9X1QZJ5_9FLAO|nr:hypothetical protein [Aequorivita xiaoshiensis]MCG2429581.1 hypothetical protein [Aequorivita xiaoshiensis]